MPQDIYSMISILTFSKYNARLFPPATLFPGPPRKKQGPQRPRYCFLLKAGPGLNSLESLPRMPSDGNKEYRWSGGSQCNTVNSDTAFSIRPYGTTGDLKERRMQRFNQYGEPETIDTGPAKTPGEMP